MPNRASEPAAPLLSVLKANMGVLALALTLLTLIAAVVAVSVALMQFYGAKRAFALNAVATTIGLYSAPKGRFYDVILENAELLEQDDAGQSPSRGPDPGHVGVLANLNLRDYLHGIEVACSIYHNGFLDGDQKRFIADYLKGDLELLLYSYDEGSGEVGKFFASNEQVGIAWIKPDGEPTDELQPYEATRACFEEWGMELAGKSFF